MSRRTIIETSWASYREQCIPSTATHAQVVESRRTFYAGAVTIFSEILTNLSPGQEVTEGDFKMLDDIKAELYEYEQMLSRAEQEDEGRR